MHCVVLEFTKDSGMIIPSFRYSRVQICIILRWLEQDENVPFIRNNLIKNLQRLQLYSKINNQCTASVSKLEQLAVLLR